MKVRQEAIHLIAKWEGLAKVKEDGLVYPYLDNLSSIPDLFTVGYGLTYIDGIRVKQSDGPFTKEWCLYKLEEEVVENYARKVRRSLGGLDLPDDMFGALTSFTFNLGIGNFNASTLRRKILRGDYIGAASEFKRWNKSGGRVLRGLTRRRADETLMYIKGVDSLLKSNEPT